MIRQLRYHSKTPNATYAYYFTNLYNAPKGDAWWYLPPWVKTSADHGDEIPFVWGFATVKENYTQLAAGNDYVLLSGTNR